MIDTNDLDRLLDSGTVVAEDGSKIGKVSQIFLDDDTSRPEWVTVATGLFGNAESFVPLQGATSSGDEIRVPYSKDKVKDAPRISDSDGHLERSEEDELYRYYGIGDQGAGFEEGTAGYEERTAGVGTTGTTTETTGTTGTRTDTESTVGTGDAEGTVGRDTRGRSTDDAMTRSEERLDIGTERRSAGRARLRKYVVTENVTQTVPVSHEEVRVEREPITEENRDQALSGADISSGEHEVELTEERVVVSKETVPVERVRLDKETVTEEQQVDEEVRKEQIEADSGTAAGRDEGDVRR